MQKTRTIWYECRCCGKQDCQSLRSSEKAGFGHIAEDEQNTSSAGKSEEETWKVKSFATFAPCIRMSCMKNRKKHYSVDKILDSLNKKVWYNTVGISMQDVVCLVNLFCKHMSYRESIAKAISMAGDYPNRKRVRGILNKGKLHSLPLS